ncbi:23S rRNA (adenine(1618)-N(6))-methyltransferase RlmF [Mucilaginibacter glaciei]|uniref:Ribosomal RNA large subunit methyltransferase F n=1 Tax=Mucilaginibacter glaciei TaxID=2772109 RepID=A0A926NJZ1_9SPHI|nr:23S rRNA (adenine(1618)-N(6))-methyltransferase RlmF [Mucilaginibacter glaciei]MBD1393464.1 23S rRNA (adenine(1618)-N(6))-methyltransferase RlmF [Mucilaginibacter glaciei]
MADKPEQPADEKLTLHPRNPHRSRYNFPKLIKALPALRDFVFDNQYNDLSIDFTDPEAVKTLNKALLKKHYGVAHWDIPEGFLCPPIPGRADYIHYMADVLAEANGAKVPEGSAVKVLDVGVGANCIYPLVGNKTYGWSFRGTDVNDTAVSSAKKIVADNELAEVINVWKQGIPDAIFKGVINEGDQFDFTMCNPPFHASWKEAAAGSRRKWNNLDTKEKSELNFGGRNNELWCEGGEARFLNKMIAESVEYDSQVCWFSSLISKKETLPGCYKSLDYFKAVDVKTITMSQGQKTSRILAWTFLDKTQREQWFANKPK